MPRKHPKVLQAETAKKAKAKPKLSKQQQMQLSQDKPVGNAMSEGFLSYITSYLDKRLRVCASDVQN